MSERWLGKLSLVFVLLMALAVSLREVGSHDIGYHLAYGEHFLDTGELVDHNGFLYTLPENADAEPGPGAWYDDEGRYRFANANWLSQVVFAATYRAGGDTGLSVLTAATFLLLLLVHVIGLRACGVGPLGTAACVALLAWIQNLRLDPRPELLGYPVLSAQLYLLLATVGRGRPLPRAATVALVLLQLLMVNLHSYFLLGLAVSGAMWAAVRTREMAVALVGQLLACLANPWTWRLAVLPVETLLFLRGEHINDPAHRPRHPWSIISEFHPLPMPWDAAPITLAASLFHLVLLVAAAALVFALLRRRWGHALVLVGLALVGLSMRRNVPTSALFLLPTAAVVLVPVLAEKAGSWSDARRRLLARGLAGGLVVVSVLALGLVFTGRYDSVVGIEARSGTGFARDLMPIEAARWIDENEPEGRLWTDFGSSSNAHFLIASRPGVPILTNTWAYPPDTMRGVLDRLVASSTEGIEELGAEVLLLETGPTAANLVEAASRHPGWALVHLEPKRVLFVRGAGPNGDLARAAAIREEDHDWGAWAEHWNLGEDLDGLADASHALRLLGWFSQAIVFTEQLLEQRPDDVQKWSDLGAMYAQRGFDRLGVGDRSGREDLEAASRALGWALQLDASLPGAAQNKTLVDRTLASMD